MIARYFFCAWQEGLKDGTGYVNGSFYVRQKAWFPHPNTAFDYALEHIKNDLKRDGAAIVRFNRI